MKRIVVFTAQSFGFGPARKMIAIAEEINNDVYKIFFGSKVAYDLAKTSHFDEYHYLDHSNKEQILTLLSRSDIFINVMDFPLGILAKKVQCHYVVVDSLLWFYGFRPDVDYATFYFVQNFMTSTYDKIKAHNIKNATVVGPILDNNKNKNKVKKNQCIINFGGCDGYIAGSYIHVGKNSNYPILILKLLLPEVLQRFSNVLVTGRKSAMDYCQKHFTENNVSFKMLHFKEMLCELEQSKVIFSVPGIQSFFDAADKIPIFFLPPSNHSHQSNLNVFVQKMSINSYFSWKDYYFLEIKEDQTRQHKINLILKTIEKFSHDADAKNLFKEKVRKFMRKKNQWNNIVDKQIKALRSLGDNGLDEIINKINTLLTPTTSGLTENICSCKMNK